MSETFTAQQSIAVSATAEKVWSALTDPVKIKKYLFGTNVVSDWKLGSTITYKGEWEGKQYEDKGVIRKLVPNELLVTTYWSSMSGLPDTPENYATVTYKLSRSQSITILTIIQDNCKTQESAHHSEDNWLGILKGLKKVVEAS